MKFYSQFNPYPPSLPIVRIMADRTCMCLRSSKIPREDYKKIVSSVNYRYRIADIRFLLNWLRTQGASRGAY